MHCKAFTPAFIFMIGKSPVPPENAAQTPNRASDRIYVRPPENVRHAQNRGVRGNGLRHRWPHQYLRSSCAFPTQAHAETKPQQARVPRLGREHHAVREPCARLCSGTPAMRLSTPQSRQIRERRYWQNPKRLTQESLFSFGSGTTSAVPPG